MSIEGTITAIVVSVFFGLCAFIAYLSIAEAKVYHDEVTIIDCQRCVYNSSSEWLIEAKMQDGTTQKFIREQQLLPTGNSKLLIAHMYSFSLPHNRITKTEPIADNEKIIRIP
jgi:hypothetical protein